MAGIVNLFAGGFFVGAIEFNFEIFADVDCADAVVTHVGEGALDGFALRIENRFLGCDDDLRFQQGACWVMEGRDARRNWWHSYPP